MNGISRRSFGRFLGALGMLAILGWSVVLEGCGSFAQILAWVQTGLDSFQSVIDLLVGQNIIMIAAGSAIDLIVKGVKAAISDIGAAVDAYNAAPATDKSTLAGKITTAIIAAQDEISQFWNDLNIPDAKIAATVAGLLGLIVATLAGFLTQLPPAPATLRRKTFAKTLTAAPQRLSVKQFKSQFNAILEGNGFSQYRRF